MNKCLKCDKETKNNKFCSRSCAVSVNNLNPKRKLSKTCKSCSAKILSDRRYCKSCWKSSHLSGLDLSLFCLKDFTDKRNYQRHSRVRALARAFLLKNGLLNKCDECGYDKHVEVCHIKSIKDFDENSLLSDINHITNLKVLCPNCHWEFDNIVKN